MQLAAGGDGKKDGRGGVSWRHSVYGALSGATARTCVAPFERLKILLEVTHTAHHSFSSKNR